ncbi:MAG: hypothetical protein M1445_06425 [Bacteroidetes bacterium]|nr:hypothetical protein [Bacteroidota bacterium]
MMKTNKQNGDSSDEKSTLDQLREIRDKISVETQDMTFEQLKKYVEEQLSNTLHPSRVWR